MKKINCLQMSSMMVLIIVSSLMGIGTYTLIKTSGIDSYISIFFAALLGIPVLLLFLYIFSYEPDLPLPAKLNKLFGPIIGKIFTWIILILIFSKGITYMFNLTNFIVSQFLPETPPWVIGLSFSVVIIYANLKGIQTISRIALLLLVINILLFVFGEVFGLIPEFTFDNLKPILEFGLKRPFLGSLYIVILDVVPIFMLQMIPKNNLVDNKKFKKYFTSAYAISMLLIFSMTLITLGVLGIHLASIYQFPEYIVLKHVTIFGFLDRIENMITAQWIFGIFFCITYVVYFVSNCIKTNHKSRLLPTIITILLLLGSLYLIPNNTFFNYYMEKIAPLLGILLFIIMIIIGITIFIKKIPKEKFVQQKADI